MPRPTGSCSSLDLSRSARRAAPLGQDVRRCDPVPDLATKPTLRGRLVTLRPFRAGDVEVMAQVLSDPEVRRLTGSVESTAEAERPEPVDDRLRDWYATRNEQADRLDLAIEDAATGRLVGEVVLNEVDLDGLTCNLRVLIGPEGATGARHRGRRVWRRPTASRCWACGGSPWRSSSSTRAGGGSTRRSATP